MQARTAVVVLSKADPAAAAAALEAIDRAIEETKTDESDLEALRREVDLLRATNGPQAGLFEAVLNQSPQGIIISDTNGKLIFQNPAAERIWAGSATADSVKAWGQYRAFHPDGRAFEATDWSMFRSLSKREITVAEEMAIQRFDDTRAVVLGSSAPILGDGGVLLGAVSVFADVTRWKQVERELRLSQQRYATTLSSIGDAVIATSADSLVNFMNPIAEALTGWSAEDATGKPLREVFHIVNETTRAEVESPVEKGIATGAVVGLANHTLLIRKNGSELAIDDSAAPIRDESGKLAGMVLVFRDATLERKKARQREFLLEATARLASSMDVNGTLASIARLAVPELADWCSVELASAADASFHPVAVAHVDPEKVKLAHELRRKFPPDPNAPAGVPNVLRTGKSELVTEVPPGLFEKLVKDPEQLRIARELGLNSWMIVPLRAHGKMLGAITFVGAHSSRRYNVEDLAFAEELANCAALAVDNARLFEAEKVARLAAVAARESEQRLIGIVSHDLRNPLAAIGVSAAGLLNREGNDERTVKALGRIIGSSDRAVRMIRDLLDLTQARLGGGLPIQRVSCNAHLLTQQVIDEVQVIHPERPRVVAVLTGDGQGSWDPDRLAQALGNLLSNAMAYGGDAAVAVTTTGQDGEVVFEINNKGEPIAEARLETLFEPFERGTGREAGNSGSIGLGLFIVRQIVQAHHGTVTVRSVPLEGTTFTVRLPRS